MEPVKRVQSPISTASPNAGRDLDAAQAHQRVNHRGVATCRGRGRDVLVDARQVRGEQLGLLDIGLVGELQHRFVKALAVQPQPVFLRPPGLLGVADAVAQQDRVHVLAGMGEVLGRAGAQPGQVPQGFFLRRRDPHLGDRADGEHFGQHPGVAPVGFDPVPGARSSFEDAATTQSMPAARRYRARTYPVGPDS